MYTSIHYEQENNRIHLWDDHLGYKSFPYKKYAYIEDEDGDHHTIFGQPVKKIFKWNDGMKDSLFESDISPEMRTLIDLYYNAEDDDYPENRIITFDIEVETDNTFPDIEKADNKITGISVYDHSSKKYYAYILDPDGKIGDKDYTDASGKRIILTSNFSESELLEDFISLIEQIRPTILTGWNIEFFDIPYLVRRMNRVVGPHNTQRLSPIGLIRYSEFKKRFIIAGVSLLDYLALYKKFTFSEEASYRLDAIAIKELGKGKTEFEGSLQNLYETDLEKFIEYNINDVELIVDLDNKKKFLELAVGISHKGRIPYEDIFYSSRYLEGAILCDLKKKKQVAPNKPAKNNADKTFVGAFVKIPVPGFYEWVFDLDLTSLYPSIIMSLNISPETKVSKIIDWNEEDFLGGKDRTWRLYHFEMKQEVTIDTTQLTELLKQTKYHISSNGVIYLPNETRQGVIPTILSKWFDERVRYKNLMKKYGKAKEAEKYDYYDKLQNIQKVLLNSLYGVLGLPIFRFYDLDNAAAVTTTGQNIIKFSESKGNEFFNNLLETKNKDYCIYIDTDSLFFSASPILDKIYPDQSDTKTTISNVLSITTQVQKYINDSYTEFAKHGLNIHGKHRFEIKQELICRSALWTAKKRYAQWVINKEGILVDKLDVKGLDVVRSSFPPAFRGFMENLLINILKAVPKDKIDDDILKLEAGLNDISVLDISKNTSINDIVKYQTTEEDEYYTDRIFSTIKKGTPAHVRAAISFNDLLKYFKLDKKYSGIKNGEKIKWCYLKKNEFGIDKIAFRGYEDPPQVLEFIEKYIDRKEIYEAELRTKIENIYKAIGWTMPSHAKKLAQQFFKFE